MPLALICLIVTISAQTPGAPDALTALLREGERALSAGEIEKGLAAARKALALSSRSFRANHQAGIASDLLGRYSDARVYFAKAIELASTPQAKAEARRSLAVSYAFENNCAEASKRQTPQYEAYLEAKQFLAAGDVAYELGDICLEAGDHKLGLGWYSTGRAAAREDPKVSPAERERWILRHAHARARLSARRGDNAAALTFLKSAKAIHDKRTHPDQAPVYPYVAGYVAFYDGNYKGALPRLRLADQDDPLVLSLLAQTYEKLGNQPQATRYYRKVLGLKPTHDLRTAFARPLAQKKLATPEE